MVFKKPYAFLIKHFRLIHIILTILSVFIAIESYRILSFFTGFVKNDYSASIIENMASEYISPILYMVLVINILILIIMLVLLKIKNKPVKTYIFSILYYFILLIFIIIAAFLLNGLENALWSVSLSRLYRDIALMVYYPQFIIIIILAIRAIGFNVKKFNFKNDLREMEITDADSEEIELNIHFDMSNAQRSARRFIRETGYYYKENRLMIMTIAVIGIIIIGFTIYKNYEKTIFRYQQGDKFTVDGLKFKINNSIITNTDMKGNIINPDNSYLILSLEISNDTLKDIDFKYDNFKLYIGNKYTYPDLSFSKYFVDCGSQLRSSVIKSKTTNSYIIPYVIDNKNVGSVFQIGMYIGNASNKKSFIAKKAFVKLQPIELIDKVDSGIFNQGTLVYVGNSLIKDVSFKIDNAEVTTRYSYNYESCYRENCNTYTNVIVADPTYLNRQSLIVMDYELVLDNTANSYEKINNVTSFLESFATVEYGNGDRLSSESIRVVTPNTLTNKIVMQTSGAIINAKKVNLVITIRNQIYRFIIKNE